MDVVGRVGTSEAYKSFAVEQTHGGSAIYEHLATSIATDSHLLAVIDQMPPIKRQPNLLFAAVRFLEGPIGDFGAFKSWTLNNWEQVSAVMRVRLTQTNEVARCASLLPLLVQLPGPLALLEVGASAGLCLYPDRYRYLYGDHQVGDPNSPLLLTCETTGPVPIPDGVPEVVWRGGIDLNPLDLTDSSDVRWLESLIWPEQTDRLARFRIAAGIVQEDPPNIVKGDLNDDLLALVDSVPLDATLVIYHSAVLAYISDSKRQSFVESVRQLRGHWISNEGPRVLPDSAKGVAALPPGSPARFLMALDGRPMAWTAPHGQSMEWLKDNKGVDASAYMSDFYDKVAKQFGGYDLSESEPRHTSEYPNGDPEEVFKAKILDSVKPNFAALDIGCGDGTFSFSIADKFTKIVGLDSSNELIHIANQKKTQRIIGNIDFVYADAGKTPFGDDSFDIIFNRRGPSFYHEYARLLREGGHYFEIGIGEKDAMELKKTFGRGQNYGAWDDSRLDRDKFEFESVGLNVIFAQDFFYSESYLSENEFELFLGRVPIFQDFDPVKDRENLDRYCSKYMIGSQVKLDRHRVVYVVQN